MAEGRIFQAQRLECGDNNLGDTKVCEPFVVSWDNEPWRPICARLIEHLLVCFHIVVPILSFPDVGSGKFPVFFFPFDPFEKSRFLFLLRNVQEKLQNNDAIAYQVSLETIDFFKSPFPKSIRFCREWEDVVVPEGPGGPGSPTPLRSTTD